VAGGTGHANVVPVDVLEEHLRVPPCQGTGLKKGLLLFQMFADEWDDMVDLGCWPQFISSATPVLVSPVFLL